MVWFRLVGMAIAYVYSEVRNESSRTEVSMKVETTFGSQRVFEVKALTFPLPMWAVIPSEVLIQESIQKEAKKVKKHLVRKRATRMLRSLYHKVDEALTRIHEAHHRTANRMHVSADDVTSRRLRIKSYLERKFAQGIPCYTAVPFYRLAGYSDKTARLRRERSIGESSFGIIR